MYKRKATTKLLLVTSAAFTFGLTNLSPINLFQKPSTAHAAAYNMGYDQFMKWVLEGDRYLGASVKTVVTDIKEIGTETKVINSYPLHNKTSVVRAMKIPKSTYTTTDSITTSDSKERSYGQAVHFEYGVKDIWKGSGDLTFNQKNTSSTNKAVSNAQTHEMGGDPIIVNPGQSITVEFVYEQKRYSGTLEDRRPINDHLIEGGLGKLMDTIALRHYQFADGREGSVSAGSYHGSKGSGGRQLNSAYDIFNLVNTARFDSGIPPEQIFLEMYFPHHQDHYKIPVSTLEQKIALDHQEKKAYVKNHKTSFTGVNGVRITQTIKDTTTGEILQSQPVITF